MWKSVSPYEEGWNHAVLEIMWLPPQLSAYFPISSWVFAGSSVSPESVSSSFPESPESASSLFSESAESASSLFSESPLSGVVSDVSMSVSEMSASSTVSVSVVSLFSFFPSPQETTKKSAKISAKRDKGFFIFSSIILESE